jgi:hypothetical protein
MNFTKYLKAKNSMENPVKIYYYDGIRLPRKLKKRLRKQGYIF